MKNQKGVTLIALVITIIVLLILAGVSIAMLTGDNGILTQAKSAKIQQIEGKVREEVNLAVQATKMYAENKAVTTTEGWFAESKIGKAEDEADADTVIGQLKNDLPASDTDGYSFAVSGTKVKITYTSPDYKSARNKSDAKITVDVTLSENTFTVGAFSYLPTETK